MLTWLGVEGSDLIIDMQVGLQVLLVLLRQPLRLGVGAVGGDEGPDALAP
jgi:hypothetical protein